MSSKTEAPGDTKKVFLHSNDIQSEGEQTNFSAINRYLENVAGHVLQINQSALNDIVEALLKLWASGKKLFVIGNGGSAATAEHFVVDLTAVLNERAPKQKYPFRAIALSGSGPMNTCLSNDMGFEHGFATQICYLYEEGDMLLAISGSGMSENLIQACVEFPPSAIIAMVGFNGGRLKDLAGFCLHIPVENQQIAEDCHAICCHCVFLELLRRAKESS